MQAFETGQWAVVDCGVQVKVFQKCIGLSDMYSCYLWIFRSGVTHSQMQHTTGDKLHQMCSHILEILCILKVRGGAWKELLEAGRDAERMQQKSAFCLQQIEDVCEATNSLMPIIFAVRSILHLFRHIHRIVESGTKYRQEEKSTKQLDTLLLLVSDQPHDRNVMNTSTTRPLARYEFSCSPIPGYYTRGLTG